MQINIDKKPGFKISGKSFTINNREESEKLREEFLEDFKEKGLEEFGAMFALMEYDAINQDYKYFLGFETSDEDFINENNLEVREVEESLYLEVPVENSDLESGYKYTYEEFFPNKKYFHNIGPDIEFYQYDQENEKIGNVELYIALKENPHA